MGEERVFVATLSKLNRINHGNKFEVIGYKSVGLLAGLYSVVQKEQRIMHDKRSEESSLEQSYQTLQPMDPDTARTVLVEVKKILDQLGVIFFLRQGTCLGAIRDKGFIPWDDDLDLGSVIGLHGFTEEQVDPVIVAFKELGYYTKLERYQEYLYIAMMKSNIRIDWTCYRIVDDNIIHFPGVPIPVHLITRLKEIEFAGETFLVPNPPEDYLSAKYGPNWMIPKSSGYEKDILAMIPDLPIQQRQSAIGENSDSSDTRVRILDQHGEPVKDALVRVARHGIFRTNEQGYAQFRLPEENWYSLVINHSSHEEVLYQERLARGITYVYRPDPSTTSGRWLVLSQE